MTNAPRRAPDRPRSWPGRAAWWAAVLAALPVPGGVSAQSLLGARGLGVPVEALDARAAALGNLGIGLRGVEVSAGDPGSWARLAIPAVVVTMQPTWGTFELGEQAGRSRATRFPLLGMGYPVPRARGVATLSLAGYLEQRWVAESSGTVVLDDAVVDVKDRFTADGGVSVVRLGWAQRLGRRLAVGASAGAYVGALTETFDRELDSADVGGAVYSFLEEDRWSYGGATLNVGVSADPADVLHVAAAAEWSLDLRETPVGDTLGESASYSIPARFSAGATGRLTPRLHLNASVVHQNWSGAEGFADEFVSARKWNFGTGLEWLVVDGETRSLPLRFGYRRLAAPFRHEAEDPAESIWSVGAGVNLAKRGAVRFGWVDVALERATRRSAPLEERFWRASVSVGIARF